MIGSSTDRVLDIAGAGPAGLAAAITAARAGAKVRVRERRNDVGKRFSGDFQGLENWTTKQDVLEQLEASGIEPTFDHIPFNEVRIFDGLGRDYVLKSPEALWYQVRRGPLPGSLDYSLRDQAIRAGADVQFGQKVEHLPEGGIVAHGPRRPDIIAVGYVMETDLPNGAFALVSDDFAPKGYSYLLIADGHATLASCMFTDFQNEKVYLDRTVDFFRDRVGIDFSNGKRFGGFGNAYSHGGAIRRGSLLFAGEAAGFQDALFGFGIRYAVTSGQLAAQAWLSGKPETYDRLCRDQLNGLVKIGMVNRYLYEQLGSVGYPRFLRRISRARDARDWMRRHYTAGGLRMLLAPLARRRIRQRREIIRGLDHDDCDCTWCRCTRHDEPASTRIS